MESLVCGDVVSDIEDVKRRWTEYNILRQLGVVEVESNGRKGLFHSICGTAPRMKSERFSIFFSCKAYILVRNLQVKSIVLEHT